MMSQDSGQFGELDNMHERTTLRREVSVSASVRSLASPPTLGIDSNDARDVPEPRSRSPKRLIRAARDQKTNAFRGFPMLVFHGGFAARSATMWRQRNVGCKKRTFCVVNSRCRAVISASRALKGNPFFPRRHLCFAQTSFGSTLMNSPTSTSPSNISTSPSNVPGSVSQSDTPTTGGPLPMWLRVGFTAFMAVLVPYYWVEYGPTNFIYFCDIALFLALAAVWTEKPIFASMAAIGLVLPQMLWQVDFLTNVMGIPIVGMTDYMFDSNISLFGRGLSFFHFWLPILLIMLVVRLGYDRRAFWAWTLTAWTAMLISYFCLPEPGAVLDFVNQPSNVNYVYGMSAEAPQTMMPGWTWMMLLMVGLPSLVYLPTHWFLRRWA